MWGRLLLEPVQAVVPPRAGRLGVDLGRGVSRRRDHWACYERWQGLLRVPREPDAPRRGDLRARRELRYRCDCCDLRDHRARHVAQRLLDACFKAVSSFVLASSFILVFGSRRFLASLWPAPSSPRGSPGWLSPRA